MKRYIKNFMMAMMVGATVFGSSCTDSFEEVNTDPDSPTDVPTTNLLAYSLYYTSYRLYDRWFAMDASGLIFTVSLPLTMVYSFPVI